VSGDRTPAAALSLWRLEEQGAGDWELTGIEPRPLHRGWPLYEPPGHFAQGSILDCSASDLIDFAVRQALGRNSGGWWECDLSDDSLTWTAGIYEMFGLPQGAKVSREDAVALYSEESRAAMQRLRSYAIENQRPFVLDARIRPPGAAEERWMRLIAAPVVEGGRTVRLHGLKLWV
jgi:PAS domain-containing protein